MAGKKHVNYPTEKGTLTGQIWIFSSTANDVNCKTTQTTITKRHKCASSTPGFKFKEVSDSCLRFCKFFLTAESQTKNNQQFSVFNNQWNQSFSELCENTAKRNAFSQNISMSYDWSLENLLLWPLMHHNNSQVTFFLLFCSEAFFGCLLLTAAQTP